MAILTQLQPTFSTGASLADRPDASAMHRTGAFFLDLSTGSLYVTTSGPTGLRWTTLLGSGALSNSYLLKWSGILIDGVSSIDLADTGGTTSDQEAPGVAYAAVAGALAATGAIYVLANSFATATELRVYKNLVQQVAVPIAPSQTGLINFAIPSLALAPGDTVTVQLHADTPGAPGELVQLGVEILFGNS